MRGRRGYESVLLGVNAKVICFLCVNSSFLTRLPRVALCVPHCNLPLDSDSFFWELNEKDFLWLIYYVASMKFTIIVTHIIKLTFMPIRHTRAYREKEREREREKELLVYSSISVKTRRHESLCRYARTKFVLWQLSLPLSRTFSQYYLRIRSCTSLFSKIIRTRSEKGKEHVRARVVRPVSRYLRHFGVPVFSAGI